MKSGQHIKMKCRFSATISNLKKVAYFDKSRPVKVGKFAKRMRCMSLAVLFLVKARSFARPAFSNFSNSFFVGAFCRRLSKWTNVLEKARRLYAGLSLAFVYSSLSLPLDALILVEIFAANENDAASSGHHISKLILRFLWCA